MPLEFTFVLVFFITDLSLDICFNVSSSPVSHREARGN